MRRSIFAVVVLTALGTTISCADASPGADALGAEIYSVAVNGSGQQDLSNSSGNDRWPAVSPEGRRIAFVSDRDGFDAVYVMASDGGGQARVSGDAPLIGIPYYAYHLESPVWSPDGRSILVDVYQGGDSRYPNGSLFIVPAGGGPVRALGPTLEGSVTASFSPDSRYVAYQRQRGPFGATDSVAVFDLAGTAPAISFGFGDAMAWSPRVDRLAYIASPTGLLTVAGPDRGHRWTMHTKVSGGWAWSPQGRWIAFIHDLRGAPTLYLVRPGANHIRRVITLPAAADLSRYAVSWSADGHWLAATNSALTFLVHPNGTGFEATLGGALPTWAPQGATLAFLSYQGSSTAVVTWPHLSLVSDSSANTQYFGLAWSHNGSRVIFSRYSAQP